MLTMQGGDSLVGGLPIIHITYQQYIANPSAYQDPDVIVHISGYPTAGNLPADYVGYDSNLNMEDIGNIATKAIAKVEPSDTALYLHKVGTGFINKDGNYCITDVQISVGGTITLGTNCHVVDGGISSNLDYSGDYSVYGIPYFANWGGIFISFDNPIPANQRSLYKTELLSMVIGSGSQTIIVTVQDSEKNINALGGIVTITASLSTYFSQSGAVFTSLSQLVQSNACVGVTIRISKI